MEDDFNFFGEPDHDFSFKAKNTKMNDLDPVSNPDKSESDDKTSSQSESNSNDSIQIIDDKGKKENENNEEEMYKARPKTNILNKEEIMQIINEQKKELNKKLCLQEIKRKNWKSIPENVKFNPVTKKYEKKNKKLDDAFRKEVNSFDKTDFTQSNNNNKLRSDIVRKIKDNPNQAKEIILKHTVAKMSIDESGKFPEINNDSYNNTKKQFHDEDHHYKHTSRFNFTSNEDSHSYFCSHYNRDKKASNSKKKYDNKDISQHSNDKPLDYDDIQEYEKHYSQLSKNADKPNTVSFSNDRHSTDIENVNFDYFDYFEASSKRQKKCKSQKKQKQRIQYRHNTEIDRKSNISQTNKNHLLNDNDKEKQNDFFNAKIDSFDSFDLIKKTKPKTTNPLIKLIKSECHNNNNDTIKNNNTDTSSKYNLPSESSPIHNTHLHSKFNNQISNFFENLKILEIEKPVRSTPIDHIYSIQQPQPSIIIQKQTETKTMNQPIIESITQNNSNSSNKINIQKEIEVLNQFFIKLDNDSNIPFKIIFKRCNQLLDNYDSIDQLNQLIDVLSNQKKDKYYKNHQRVYHYGYFYFLALYNKLIDIIKNKSIIGNKFSIDSWPRFDIEDFLKSSKSKSSSKQPSRKIIEQQSQSQPIDITSNNMPMTKLNTNSINKLNMPMLNSTPFQLPMNIDMPVYNPLIMKKPMHMPMPMLMPMPMPMTMGLPMPMPMGMPMPIPIQLAFNEKTMRYNEQNPFHTIKQLSKTEIIKLLHQDYHYQTILSQMKLYNSKGNYKEHLRPLLSLQQLSDIKHQRIPEYLIHQTEYIELYLQYNIAKSKFILKKQYLNCLFSK